jgi:hypothetical protein
MTAIADCNLYIKTARKETIMRTPFVRAALLFLLALGSTIQAQQSQSEKSGFTFKNNYFGMSLAKFKSANAGDQVFLQFPKIKGQKKRAPQLFPTPICSDVVLDVGKRVMDMLPNEMICDVSAQGANPDARMVAGAMMDQILYRFYGGRLYRIDIQFPASDFADVKDAFQEKYGEPSKIEPVIFENVFGASWTSHDLSWQHGTQLVVLIEGPGNGPGQNQFSSEFPYAMLYDASYGPPRTPKKPLDF